MLAMGCHTRKDSFLIREKTCRIGPRSMCSSILPPNSGQPLSGPSEKLTDRAGWPITSYILSLKSLLSKIQVRGDNRGKRVYLAPWCPGRSGLRKQKYFALPFYLNLGRQGGQPSANPRLADSHWLPRWTMWTAPHLFCCTELGKTSHTVLQPPTPLLLEICSTSSLSSLEHEMDRAALHPQDEKLESLSSKLVLSSFSSRGSQKQVLSCNGPPNWSV